MTSRFARNALATAAGLLGIMLASTAWSQATRTWVSGVGDDANPCSRTAPCKTFAGAISKTAVAGEINALDPAGFGAVTITKSITISGTGTNASILSSLTNAVNVNDGATASPGTIVVTLRNLSINGGGNGLVGINFVSGARLNLENVEIQGTTQEGVRFVPSGNASLWANNVSIHETAGGVLIAPTGSAFAGASISNSSIVNSSSYGARFSNRSNATLKSVVVQNSAGDAFDVNTTTGVADIVISSSVASDNGGHGFVTQATGGGTSVLMLTDSSSLQNSMDGTRASGNSIIWLAGSRITRNGSTGINPVAPGQIWSLGDNNNTFNWMNGAPTGTYAKQ